jgi:hypothetical protein
MTIVSTDYRPKRSRKRKKSPAIPQRIVSAKQPKPEGPAIDQAVTERKRPAQAAAISGPRIVTAKKPRPKWPAINPPPAPEPAPVAPVTKPRIVTVPRKHSTRFGPVQDIDAEEHQRRGDAAVELFREIARRARGDAGT